MNNKNLLLVSKIIAVILAIYGGLITFAALAMLVGSGAAGVADTMGAKAGVQMGAFPYVGAVGGSFLFLILAGIYFSAAYGLFTAKKWTSTALYLLAGAGVLSYIVTVSSGVLSSPLELVWCAIYGWFGYYISTKKKVFCK